MLFPPYWIVTVGGFILAGVTGMKSFDTWQVVSQMAGTGYFTHGDHIVNIASWFMSPLLLLYLAVTVTRLVSVRVMAFVLIAGLATAACLKTPEFATLRCHGATFFLAFAVGACPRENRMSAAGGMLAVMMLLCIAQPEFRYGAIASLLLVAALPVRRQVLLCNRFAKISYEWFLVHGLCLAAICHLTSSRPLIVLGGMVLSITAAIILQRTTRSLTNRLVRPAAKPVPVSESTVEEILSMVDHALPNLMTQLNSVGPAVMTVDAAVRPTTVRPASKRRPFQRI
jgi:hypothetical protein